MGLKLPFSPNSGEGGSILGHWGRILDRGGGCFGFGFLASVVRKQVPWYQFSQMALVQSRLLAQWLY